MGHQRLRPVGAIGRRRTEKVPSAALAQLPYGGTPSSLCALPLPDISFEVRVPLCLLFKPGAGSGESRGRPLGQSPPDPRADSTVNPA
jgi:hypothetical protein